MPGRSRLSSDVCKEPEGIQSTSVRKPCRASQGCRACAYRGGRSGTFINHLE